tara:strand:- start:213 stop:401 length:189 start_codon:yes stop_codon:yes gene_type:complete
MSYIQTVTYRKLPSGKKHYIKEIFASSPNAAKVLIQNSLGEGKLIEIIKCVTSYDVDKDPNF